ncbi:hypothetical protein JOM56_007435 [Amanita muscaria]
MENPWADPWNHSQKPAEEADLANPSWSTGTGIQWDEPSDFPSLWNNNSTDAAAAWVPPKSPYDDLPIGRTLSQSDVDPSDSPVSESHGTIGFQTAPASPTQDSPPSPAPPLSHPTPFASTRSTSPDGYGTFESANTDIGAGAWTTSATSFPSGETEDGNAWGAAWAPVSDPPDEEEPQLDEWEMAKMQKEKQDQHVPPELLASIVRQAKELSNDLWPESRLDKAETRQPSKDFMADVPELASAVEMFVPENLVLPPHVQLAKTFTVKHMNEALRLTKHLPMTLSSPLAIYLASKGSTAWEASVKSNHDIHPDDVLPPGWRMVEKDKHDASPVPEAKKKPGGLLSFLGLKNSDGSTESTSQKLSPSSSRPTSIIGSVKSPRSSMDGSSKPASERQFSISQPTTMTSPAPTSSASVPLPVGDQTAPQEVTVQPSVVSRFLGRFSRSSAASSQASGSQSQSIALSSDDIEFLSDIIPSANDDADADEDIKSLTTLITAKPPRVSSLPQPLPPPPKPPFLPPPPPGANTRMQGPSTKLPEVDDLFSLFNTEQSLTSKESKSIQSLVPLGSVREILSAPDSSTLPTASFRPSARPTTPLPVTIMTPSPRAHTSTVTPAIPSYSQRRNVTAIMSDSGRTGSNLHAPLPPAPLPPPPVSPGPLARPSLPSLVSLQSQQPTSLFDDDEFSDFMSSPSTTVFPPQPSILPATTTTLSNLTTSSTVSGRVDTSSSITSFSSALSNQSLFHSSSSSDFGLDGFANSTSAKSGLGLLDDDFADFVSPSTSTLPTPSPLRPPSNPPTSAAPRPQGKPLSSLSRGLPMKEPLSLPPTLTKHDHSRVANLVESAAARPGRWPATTPPLPHPIVPPPLSSAGKTSLNIFGDLAAPPPKPSQTSTSTTHNNNPLRTNLAVQAANKPNLTPPPLRAMSPPLIPTQGNGNRTSSPAPWSFGANASKPPLTPSTPSTTTGSSSSQKTGGLSAQDLSFFEGL